MPKNEVDPEDPFELCGVGLITSDDTTDVMAECFIEEFLRMRYSGPEILALFRNPFYIGMNMVLEKQGEESVRRMISRVFAQWGRVVVWPDEHSAADQKLESEGRTKEADATESTESCGAASRLSFPKR